MFLTEAAIEQVAQSRLTQGRTGLMGSLAGMALPAGNDGDTKTPPYRFDPQWGEISQKTNSALGSPEPPQLCWRRTVLLPCHPRRTGRLEPVLHFGEEKSVHCKYICALRWG